MGNDPKAIHHHPQLGLKRGDWVTSLPSHPDRPILGEIVSFYPYEDDLVTIREGAFTHVCSLGLLIPCDPPPFHAAMRKVIAGLPTASTLDRIKMLDNLVTLYLGGER